VVFESSDLDPEICLFEILIAVPTIESGSIPMIRFVEKARGKSQSVLWLAASLLSSDPDALVVITFQTARVVNVLFLLLFCGSSTLPSSFAVTQDQAPVRLRVTVLLLLQVACIPGHILPYRLTPHIRSDSDSDSEYRIYFSF
jgi:hypothetical protein